VVLATAEEAQETMSLNGQGVVIALYEYYRRASRAFSRSQHADARRLKQECLARAEKELGPRHPLVVVCLNTLSWCYSLSWHELWPNDAQTFEAYKRREAALNEAVLASNVPHAVADEYYALSRHNGDVGPTVESRRLYLAALERIEAGQPVADEGAPCHILIRLATMELDESRWQASIEGRDKHRDAAEAYIVRAERAGVCATHPEVEEVRTRLADMRAGRVR
jgi:hypothetical protein